MYNALKTLFPNYNEEPRAHFDKTPRLGQLILYVS